MRKYILLVPCIVLVAVLVMACKARPFPTVDVQVDTGPARSEQAGLPSGAVEIAQTTMDVGEVKRGEWAKHTFTIKNKSDQVLHIKNVRGS